MDAKGEVSGKQGAPSSACRSEDRQAAACPGSGMIGRRAMLATVAPACAMGCIGMSLSPARVAAALSLKGASSPESGQESHPFDVKRDRPLSSRDLVRMTSRGVVDLIRVLRAELGDEGAIRLLNEYSTEVRRRRGSRQAEVFEDRTFKSFTDQFRPPRFGNSLVHEVVEDTENTFGLRVSACVSADVFREFGVDGEIGHAAVCNMDYAWPPAFNPRFRMEREHTLMQGHGYCDHRYIQDEA